MKKLKKEIKDNTLMLSTPRELCKECYNWLTQEDVGFYDIPHCSEDDLECRWYLCGDREDCPNFSIL